MFHRFCDTIQRWWLQTTWSYRPVTSTDVSIIEDNAYTPMDGCVNIVIDLCTSRAPAVTQPVMVLKPVSSSGKESDNVPESVCSVIRI